MSDKARIGAYVLGLVAISLPACGESLDAATTPPATADAGAVPGPSDQGPNDAGVPETLSDASSDAAPNDAASASSPVSPAPKAAQIKDYSLGLNYNNDTQNYNTADVDRIYNAGTKLPRWTRFIFNMTGPPDNDGDPVAAFDQWEATGDWPTGKNQIAKYRAIHDAGVKVVVSIRWEFKKAGKKIPFVSYSCVTQNDPPCPEYKKYSRFLTKQVIPKLIEAADVLVIGNEPFLNTLDDQVKPKSNFTRFYKNIAQDALADPITKEMVWPYDKKPFYFGSFEALWDRTPPNRPEEDAAREELLTFVNNDDRISGIDLHLHSPTIEKIENAFSWLNDSNNRLFNGKEIIVTEFSPAPGLAGEMKDQVDPAFFAKWGIDTSDETKWPEPDTRNGDYLDFAIKAARPADEYKEWLSTLGYRHFVCDAWKQFRSHGRFRLAFQGATQGKHRPAGYNWEWPWIVNPILMPITVVPVDGAPAARWGWYDDVQTILKDDPTNPCP